MTRLDFTPLFRSTIGFDRMMNALETSARTGDESYPLYNTEKVDENDYRITMEVPGFAESELSIEARDATVTIEGKPARDRHEGRTYLHQGIRRAASSAPSNWRAMYGSAGRALRTACCTSTWCAKCPKRSSREPSRFATARRRSSLPRDG